jgi:hypothetical protein
VSPGLPLLPHGNTGMPSAAQATRTSGPHPPPALPNHMNGHNPAHAPHPACQATARPTGRTIVQTLAGLRLLPAHDGNPAMPP